MYFFKQAVDKHPAKSPEGFLHLARALSHLYDYTPTTKITSEQTLGYYDMAIQHNPNDPSAL
jgi:hypothetical protein